MSESDDEIWGSDDDKISSQESLKRQHFNNGYRDGITETKENFLQIGFNDGYPHGAEIGQQVGFILGTLQGLGLKDLERAATNELSVESIFSKKYWSVDTSKLYDSEVHPLVLKWQTVIKGLKSQASEISLKPTI